MKQGHGGVPSFYFNKGNSVCVESNWDPRNNIEQAFMCLFKHGQWNINGYRCHNDGTYPEYFRVDIHTEGKMSPRDTGYGLDELPLRISQLVAKATGWEE